MGVLDSHGLWPTGLPRWPNISSLDSMGAWPDMQSRPFQSNLSWLVLLVVLSCSVRYLSQQIGYNPITSPDDFLWDCLVFLTPASLVLAFERPQIDSSLKSYTESRTFAAKRRAISGIIDPPVPGRPAGLRNPRNSCFQNSILQGLASLRSLEHFLQFAHTEVPNSDARKTTEQLRDFLLEMNSSLNSSNSLQVPMGLAKLGFSLQQDAQEYYQKISDAIEDEIAKSVKEAGLKAPFGFGGTGLFPHDQIHNILQESANHEPGPPKDSKQGLGHPLQGLMAQRIGCLSCGRIEKPRIVPFLNLTLSLNQQWNSSLSSYLDEVTSVDHIDGVNCENCTLRSVRVQLKKKLAQLERLSPHDTTKDLTLAADMTNRIIKQDRDMLEGQLATIETTLDKDDFPDSVLKDCGVSADQIVTATKTRQSVLASYPEALAIHMNRSIFDPTFGMYYKNNAAVRFPKYLNVSRWGLGSVDLPEHVWKTDPGVSVLNKITEMDVDAAFASQSLYVLRCVIRHEGDHRGGHFVAYRQTPFQHMSVAELEGKRRQWWLLSDRSRTAVSETEVLTEATPYMLFYEHPSAEELEILRALGDGPLNEDVPTALHGSLETSVLVNENMERFFPAKAPNHTGIEEAPNAIDWKSAGPNAESNMADPPVCQAPSMLRSNSSPCLGSSAAEKSHNPRLSLPASAPSTRSASPAGSRNYRQRRSRSSVPRSGDNG